MTKPYDVLLNNDQSIAKLSLPICDGWVDVINDMVDSACRDSGVVVHHRTKLRGGLPLMNAKEAGMTSRTADFLVGLMTLEGEVTSTVQYKIWSIEDDYWVLELRIEVMVHYSGGLPPMAGGCKWKCDDLRGLGAALRDKISLLAEEYGAAVRAIRRLKEIFM